MTTTAVPDNPLRNPQAVHRALAERFDQHDLNGLVGLYDKDATLVPQPGVTVSGRMLREALDGFLALKPHHTFVETLAVVTAGDLALTRSRWGLRGTNPSDGNAVTLEHFGVEVMRRRGDGTWRFLVDDPFAGDDATIRPDSGEAPRPGELHQRMAQLFTEQSLDGLVDLYSDGATLVPEPGKTAAGRSAIRQALAGYLSLKPQDVKFTTVGVVRAADVALTRSRWRMNVTSDEGTVTLDHYGLEVMRRADDHETWLFAIDDPFAGDAAAHR